MPDFHDCNMPEPARLTVSSFHSPFGFTSTLNIGINNANVAW